AQRGGQIETQSWPECRDFKTGGILGIAEETIPQAEGEVIHRARRRYAYVPVAASSRVVLYGRSQAACQHTDHGRAVGQFRQRLRGDLAPNKHVTVHDLAQPTEVGLQSRN